MVTTVVCLVSSHMARAVTVSQPNQSNLMKEQEATSIDFLPPERLRAEWRTHVPLIEMPAQPQWIELYDGAWSLLVNNIKTPTPLTFPDDWGNTRALAYPYLDEAFTEESVFQWDSIFAVHTARYLSHAFDFSGSMSNFYLKQHQSGRICRELSEVTGEDVYFIPEGYFADVSRFINRQLGRLNILKLKEIYDLLIDQFAQNRPSNDSDNPPLFAWAEYEYSHFHQNSARLEQVLRVLELHLAYLESTKATVVTPLIYSKKRRHSRILFWQTPLGSGMDNTVLYGDAWVDLSSQMYMAYSYSAKLHSKLASMNSIDPVTVMRHIESADYYQKKASALQQTINDCLWSDEQGFYFNIHRNCTQKVERYTLASYWPMFAGLATQAQADRMVEKLEDPEYFDAPMPFPTLARNDSEFDEAGGYWKGGVWAPTTYMVIRGLMNYGYRAKAVAATTKYLNHLSTSYQKNKTLYEYYSISGARGFDKLNHDPKRQSAKENFVGWSGLGPISLMIELIVGVEVDEHTVRWNLAGIDEVKISNLHVNSHILTLHKQARVSENAPAIITVSATPADYTADTSDSLEIMYGATKETIPLTDISHMPKHLVIYPE